MLSIWIQDGEPTIEFYLAILFGILVVLFVVGILTFTITMKYAKRIKSDEEKNKQENDEYLQEEKKNR